MPWIASRSLLAAISVSSVTILFSVSVTFLDAASAASRLTKEQGYSLLSSLSESLDCVEASLLSESLHRSLSTTHSQTLWCTLIAFSRGSSQSHPPSKVNRVSSVSYELVFTSSEALSESSVS
ncbi:hypothetical protein Rs2_16924 [Raphanus sativus]|nr:hypothetical protein Rs2_16924 [Raphanus sativus]